MKQRSMCKQAERHVKKSWNKKGSCKYLHEINMIDQQTDRWTDRQTGRQTDRQTNRQTAGQTDRQTGPLTIVLLD